MIAALRVSGCGLHAGLQRSLETFGQRAPGGPITDARVNVVVQDLYKKFPDVKSLAEADVNEIEEIVRPCGLGKSKARDISACMKILWEQYHGNVPDDFDALLKYGRRKKEREPHHG